LFNNTSHLQEWRQTYQKAATAIQNRELKLEEASNLIEINLKLIGATAIEDKLQDKVKHDNFLSI